jgi:hypothetical protein
MAKRNRNCIWHCGRETKNISRICDHCWIDRDRIYAERKAREAAAEKKPRTTKQLASDERLRTSRIANGTSKLPSSEV